MPALVTAILFGLLLSVFFIGAWGTSDRSMRRLMLGVLLFSVVVSVLLVAWLFSGSAEPSITNTPTTAAH
jgi:hypothetical protein